MERKEKKDLNQEFAQKLRQDFARLEQRGDSSSHELTAYRNIMETFTNQQVVEAIPDDVKDILCAVEFPPSELVGTLEGRSALNMLYMVTETAHQKNPENPLPQAECVQIAKEATAYAYLQMGNRECFIGKEELEQNGHNSYPGTVADAFKAGRKEFRQFMTSLKNDRNCFRALAYGCEAGAGNRPQTISPDALHKSLSRKYSQERIGRAVCAGMGDVWRNEARKNGLQKFVDRHTPRYHAEHVASNIIAERIEWSVVGKALARVPGRVAVRIAQLVEERENTKDAESRQNENLLKRLDKAREAMNREKDNGREMGR